MNRTWPKIAFALLLLAAPAAAKRPAAPVQQPAAAEESLDSKIARIQSRIEELTREQNYLTWDCYLRYIEEQGITPDAMKLQTEGNLSRLDSIPAIAALREAMRTAGDAYTEVLRTDPEYEAVHREYVAIKRLGDKERENLNKEQYNRMYDRLRNDNPDYEPALQRMRETKRQYYTAVLRVLVDYHKAHGYSLPTTRLVGKFSTTMTVLRGCCPKIDMLDEELKATNALLRRLLARRVSEEFDGPVPEGAEAESPVSVR